jgi:hypothetical protein
VTLGGLLGPQTQTAIQVDVDPEGNVQLPLLRDKVTAEGRSEAELAQAIADAYREAGVSKDVVVTVAAAGAAGVEAGDDLGDVVIYVESAIASEGDAAQQTVPNAAQQSVPSAAPAALPPDSAPAPDAQVAQPPALEPSPPGQSASPASQTPAGPPPDEAPSQPPATTMPAAIGQNP